MLHRFILKITDKNITIDHDDGDKLNNKKYNLIPMSNAENLTKSWNKQCQRNHIKKKVQMIDMKTGEILCCFESSKKAAEYLISNDLSKGFLQGAISNACNGVRKSACGYKWRWVK